MSVLSLHVPEAWDPSQPGTAWRWCDDTGRQGALGDGSTPPTAQETWLVLPAAQVLNAVLEVARRGRWQETLPFALEERLLSDPETLQVVPGGVLADGRTPVYAIDRAWLQAALDHAAAEGFRPRVAISEAALDAAVPGEWLVLQARDGGVLIDEQGVVQVLDHAIGGGPPSLLVARLADLDGGARPRRIRIRARAELDSVQLAMDWTAALDLPCVVGSSWTDRPPAALPSGAVNLLQGRFAQARSGGIAPELLRWRPVLLLLAATLAVWLLAVGVQTWQWEREASALQARQEAALRRAFPDTRTVEDVRLQMQRGLADLRARGGGSSSDGPGRLLLRIAGVGDGLPAQLQHLGYAQGHLDLDWKCGDAACADSLRRRLLEPAHGIGRDSVQSDGSHVHARLQEQAP